MTNGRNAMVQFNDQEIHVPVGTSIGEILGKLYLVEHDVVGATMNNHLVSLETKVDGDSTISAVTSTSREGQSIMRRTATLVFHAAVQECSPGVEVQIGQTLLGGYYYQVLGQVDDLEAWTEQVNTRIAELVEMDLPIGRRTISVEALSRWVKDPFGFRAKLMRGWASPHIHMVSLDNYHDVMYGPTAPSTGSLRHTRVMPYPPGVILCFPDPDPSANSQTPPSREEATKLFGAYLEARDWNRRVGVAAVGDLTAAALEDRSDEIVHLAEALHEKKIAQIADQITSQRDSLKLICIAGPSSSGKTTFARRLSVQLKVVGIQPVSISLDDFYRRREETPLDEDGEYDFEALDALDLNLLDEKLSQLLSGRQVAMPRFDFHVGSPVPESKWVKTQLLPTQVAVIEGIHGLNPALIPSLPKENRFNVFCSALTQLIIDEHNRIFTSDLRLLRRIVRDRRYRGFSAVETIERWPSVRRGEERNIFPFQERADAMFNSTLVYEMAVLRPYAWRYLLEVPRSHPSRIRAYELLKFLELVVPILPDAVPANSVLREFIGGLGFNY